MSAMSFKDLKLHIGHKIVCVGYGVTDVNTGKRVGEYDNVALECERCGEVLLDFDREEVEK